MLSCNEEFASNPLMFKTSFTGLGYSTIVNPFCIVALTISEYEKLSSLSTCFKQQLRRHRHDNLYLVLLSPDFQNLNPVFRAVTKSWLAKIKGCIAKNPSQDSRGQNIPFLKLKN